jgi:hypothetical protein
MGSSADVPELVKWWDVVDLIDLQPEGALRLARQCKHPDAVWLASLFADDGGEPLSKERVLRVLREQGEDCRARFLEWECDPDRETGMLRRAAATGYAPALAALSRVTLGEEAVAFAEEAASKGHRGGKRRLAELLWTGYGCKKDLPRALSLLKEAAELGDAVGQQQYGERGFGVGDWERFLWFGRASIKGNRTAANDLVKETVRELKWCEAPENREKESGRILFEMGAALSGHLNMEDKLAFGVPVEPKTLFSLQRVVALHRNWCEEAKRAVRCWIWIAMRHGVVKDIRILIARQLWQERWRYSLTIPKADHK